MAKQRIGILTAGGDCPGLNAVIRGIAKATFERMGNEVEFVGIADGFSGLIHNESRELQRHEFSGILTLGGTILGSARTPFGLMRQVGVDNIDKVQAMKDNYKKMKLDCLLTLGGNGTHKTANMLFQEGLNVIGLPKTIDNDIWGTDVTFGFHTAVDIATEMVDRLHSTAASHGRVLIVEIMGNKAGWLTLYSGLAGGSDMIILPEIPYDIEKVKQPIVKRAEAGKAFSIVCVAEGAIAKEEVKFSKKEREAKRLEKGEHSASERIARKIKDETNIDTRVIVPGLIQRGGSPSAYDRVLSTQFGVYAAKLLENQIYGVSVALMGTNVTHNPLGAIAGKTKTVPTDNQLIHVARQTGITFGD